MKTIYFRTRGGGRQGWGNIYRLVSIYKLLCKKFNCLFIFEGNKIVKNFLKKEQINYHQLNENISLEDEKKIINKLQPSFLTIIEMLDCNFNRQKIYKNISNKLIVFDDILKHRYCADQVISAQNKSIKKKIKNLICDYKYFPLRKEFKNRKFKKKKINKKLKKILICLGGSSYNLGNKVLINYFKDTNYVVTVIVGNEINKDKISLYKNVNLIQNVKNISKLIWDADLVISGGGYLKIEAANLYTPMLVIPVQKHQLDLVKEFKKYCKVPYLNFPSKINNEILDIYLKKYQYSYRLNMSKLLKKKFNKNIFSKKIFEIIKKI